MSSPHEALAQLLQVRTGFELLTHDVKPSRIQLFGRVRNQHVQHWLAVARGLLIASRDASGWSVDVSRQYFLRGDKMFFGWRVIFQGPNIAEYMPSICEVVKMTPGPVQAYQEDEEIPLNVKPNRNQLRNGKGAAPAGGVPLAIATSRDRLGG